METDRNEAQSHNQWTSESGAFETQTKDARGHETENAPDNERGFLRKAGRVAVGATGLGVIFRDAKRLQPRYPQMWKDIVSVSAWRQRMKRPQMQKTSLTKDVVVNLITSGFAALLLMYGVGLAMSPYWQAMPLINKTGLFVIILLAGTQMICHLAILALKIKKQINQGRYAAKSVNVRASGTKE